MGALLRSYRSSLGKHEKLLFNNLDSIKIAYYKIQPFIPKSNASDIWKKYGEYENTCINNVQSDSVVFPQEDFIKFREYFQNELSKHLLFEE